MQATKETVQKRPHTALWIILCVVLLCAAGAALYFCRWAEKPLTLAEDDSDKKNTSVTSYFTDALFQEVVEDIMAKEKQASDLKRKYFGPEGELFKKRTSLMTPIQEEIYTAVKDIADQRGYSLVIDRSSDSAGIIYGSPKIDISNEVLQKLGYGQD